jgi:hypothetical protein
MPTLDFSGVSFVVWLSHMCSEDAGWTPDPLLATHIGVRELDHVRARGVICNSMSDATP